MNEFITFELLGSFAGMVAAVCGLTQIVKHYLNVNPKWIALFVATVLNFGYNFIYLVDFTPTGIFLLVINTLIVTGSAVGLFEGAVKPIVERIGNGTKN